jgi:hypothetical protein
MSKQTNFKKFLKALQDRVSTQSDNLSLSKLVEVKCNHLSYQVCLILTTGNSPVVKQ